MRKYLQIELLFIFNSGFNTLLTQIFPNLLLHKALPGLKVQVSSFASQCCSFTSSLSILAQAKLGIVLVDILQLFISSGLFVCFG